MPDSMTGLGQDSSPKSFFSGSNSLKDTHRLTHRFEADPTLDPKGSEAKVANAEASLTLHRFKLD